MQTGEKALLLFAEYAKWEETDYCVNNLGVVYEDEASKTPKLPEPVYEDSLYYYKDFRDTMDLEKAYLQGRFDAIPYINDSLGF